MIKRIAALLVCGALAVNVQADENYQGLAGAVTATLSYHPAIQGKRAEIEAQSGLVDSAKAGRYPNLSASAQSDDDGNDTGVLRAKQPLWAFGRIDAGIDAAELSLTAEQATLLEVQRDLMGQVVTAYQNQLNFKQRIEIADEDIAEHQALLDRIEQRNGVGMASDADVSLAQSRLYRAQAQQQRLIGQRKSALNELRRLTQVDTSVTEQIDAMLLRIPSADELRTLALQNSATVLQKQAAVEVSSQQITTSQLAEMPTLYAQVEQDVLDAPNNRDRTRVGLVIEASMDGLGFARKGRTKSAQAHHSAALHDLDSSRNEVRRQMDELLINLNYQDDLLVSQYAAVEAVEATRASYLRQYDSGRKSWLDVLNTQREYTEARQQLAQINNERAITLLKMKVLIGEIDRLAGEAL